MREIETNKRALAEYIAREKKAAADRRAANAAWNKKHKKQPNGE